MARGNALYIILVLKNHSDRNHPISTIDITNYLEEDYDIVLNRSTVFRVISEELEPSGFFREDDISEHTDLDNIQDELNNGFYLRCVEKGEGKRREKLYYYESILLESELITLFDAIETYNYFAAEDIRSISKKLSSIRPMSKKRLSYSPTRMDKEILKDDAKVLQTISELSDIIERKTLAEIEYGRYNEKLQLQRKNGYPKILRPLKLIWSNGNYYCIMGQKDHDNTLNLRIDRIGRVKELEPKNPAYKEYDKYSATAVGEEVALMSKSDYRSKHPLMYSGKLKHFTLLVNASANNMMNTLVDVFGHKINTMNPDVNILAKYHITSAVPKEKWVIVQGIFASEGGMELFATQYCQNVIIISPDTSAKKVKDRLQKALLHYK